MSRWRGIALGVLAVAYVSWVFDLFGVVAWLSGRSDALWWRLLPWALLVVFWGLLVPYLVRRWRREA